MLYVSRKNIYINTGAGRTETIATKLKGNQHHSDSTRIVTSGTAAGGGGFDPLLTSGMQQGSMVRESLRVKPLNIGFQLGMGMPMPGLQEY